MNKNIYEIELNGLELHDISSLNSLQSEAEYNTMKESIEREGQLVPIVLFKNRVVDGRHRVKALRELGEQIVFATKLPNNYTLKKVKDIVLDVEHGRRAQTASQKAIAALLHQIKNGLSNNEVMSKFGTNPKMLNLAKRIYLSSSEKSGMFGRSDLAMDMLNNRSCRYGGKIYNSISNLYKKLEEDNKPLTEEPSMPMSEVVKSTIENIRTMNDAELGYTKQVLKKIIEQSNNNF